MTSGPNPQPRWARMAALIAFVGTTAVAAVALVLTESGGVRQMPDAFSIATQGGCGRLVGGGDRVFYVNEFHCHDYALLRGGLAMGLAAGGLIAFLLRKRIERGTLLAVAALVFAVAIVNVPVPVLETDAEGFLVGGQVNHVDLDCAELNGTLSLVGGRRISTDTSEDEQCYEHIRPLVYSGRILLAGAAVIFILMALGRADSNRAVLNSAVQRTSP